MKWIRKIYLRIVCALARRRFYRATGFRLQDIKELSFDPDAGTAVVRVDPTAPVNYVEFTFTLGGDSEDGTTDKR